MALSDEDPTPLGTKGEKLNAFSDGRMPLASRNASEDAESSGIQMKKQQDVKVIATTTTRSSISEKENSFPAGNVNDGGHGGSEVNGVEDVNTGMQETDIDNAAEEESFQQDAADTSSVGAAADDDNESFDELLVRNDEDSEESEDVSIVDEQDNTLGTNVIQLFGKGRRLKEYQLWCAHHGHDQSFEGHNLFMIAANHREWSYGTREESFDILELQVPSHPARDGQAADVAGQFHLGVPEAIVVEQPPPPPPPLQPARSPLPRRVLPNRTRTRPAYYLEQEDHSAEQQSVASNATSSQQEYASGSDYSSEEREEGLEEEGLAEESFVSVESSRDEDAGSFFEPHNDDDSEDDELVADSFDESVDDLSIYSDESVDEDSEDGGELVEISFESVDDVSVYESVDENGSDGEVELGNNNDDAAQLDNDNAGQDDNQGVIVLRERDILYGQGAPIYNRPGNVHFRLIVSQHHPSYKAAQTPAMRVMIRNNVIHTLTADDRRFIKRDDANDGRHVLAEQDEVQKKVKNALRDGFRRNQEHADYGDEDVLLGNTFGDFRATHAGNLALRALVNVRLADYEMESREGKSRIRQDVINLIKAGGGRFLLPRDGSWFEVDGEREHSSVIWVFRSLRNAR